VTDEHAEPVRFANPADGAGTAKPADWSAAAAPGGVGWLDLGCGVSGDMMLGALVGAGVDVRVIAGAVDALGVGVRLSVRTVRRAGLAATKVDVCPDPDGPTPTRTWSGIRVLIGEAPLAPGVRTRALAAFGALAEAEARVHGTAVDDVHFHEVGALDAIADVVGACAGLDALGLDRLVASPVATGGGTVSTAHGVLPVPAPAVLELLARAEAPAFGGPYEVELCTPTGAALVTTAVDGYGPLPPMRVRAVGLGAGGRDLPGRANVVRLVVGDPAPAPDAGPDGAAEAGGARDEVLLEANIDDLDPRVWPEVLAALLRAGASDAWLTPILMKKGRPAHTLSVLAATERAAAMRALVFRETPTLGLRENAVRKHALGRRVRTIDVDGQPVRVKTGMLADGEVVTAQPEWEDVRSAAHALGRPARAVLAAAQAAAKATARAAGRRTSTPSTRSFG
jgi:uncharacterized protein (TIGR00299 family) protein